MQQLYLFPGGNINIGVISHQPGNNKFDMLSHFTQNLSYLFTTHTTNINFTNLKDVITTSKTPILELIRGNTCQFKYSLLYFFNTDYYLSKVLIKPKSIRTLSATPPGRMVFTITPVLLPPTIPNPRPEPSLCNSTVSICRKFSPSPA